MDLTRIFTVGGKPGLQKLVAQSKNGVIVESLEDQKRFNVPASGKISSLEDISIFCIDEDKPLKEVLELIAVKNQYKEIEVPAESALRTELGVYLSNVDDERVYTSDIKKIFKWYNLLIKSETISAEAAKEKEQVEAAEKEEKKDSEKKATKTTAKPTAKKKTTPKAAAKPSSKSKSSATRKTGTTKGK